MNQQEDSAEGAAAGNRNATLFLQPWAEAATLLALTALTEISGGAHTGSKAVATEEARLHV